MRPTEAQVEEWKEIDDEYERIRVQQEGFVSQCQKEINELDIAMQKARELQFVGPDGLPAIRCMTCAETMEAEENKLSSLAEANGRRSAPLGGE